MRLIKKKSRTKKPNQLMKVLSGELCGTGRVLVLSLWTLRTAVGNVQALP